MVADSPAVLRLAIVLVVAVVLWSARAWRVTTSGFASPPAVRIPVPNTVDINTPHGINTRPTNATISLPLATRRLLRHPDSAVVGAASAAQLNSLWQTMDTRSYSSPRIRAIMATWDRLNPELIHHVQNDSSADEFMRTTFTDEVYDVYSHLDLPVMKADMWRYSVLYAHGGVYADADAECLKPIASWWEPSKCDAVIGLENDVAVCQWTFASAPRHPLFARAISMIVDRVQAYHVQWGRDVPLMRHSDEHFVHRFTGPGVFTDAVKEEFDLKGLPNPGAVLRTRMLSVTGDDSRGVAVSACFHDGGFFGGEVVLNHFGSQWIDEDRASNSKGETARRALCVQQGGDSDSYVFKCGVEYCCGACHEQHTCETYEHCACLNKELGEPISSLVPQSWIKQREDARRSICEQKGGIGHSYGKECGVEYCCGVCHEEYACEGKLACACLKNELGS